MVDLLKMICLFVVLTWATILMLGFGLHDDLQKILKELQKRSLPTKGEK